MADSIQPLIDGLLPHLFYLSIFIVVYIETALIFAFFIPGDTLLFTAGLVVATSNELNIWLTCTLITAAAFLGDQTAYQIGRKYGGTFFARRSSFSGLLVKGEAFYEKYGLSAIMLSRFYPWFRTLIPFLAGASKMNYLRFVLTNALSSAIWGFGITWLGYGANSIPALKEGSRYIAAIFILITIFITLRNYFKAKKATDLA